MFSMREGREIREVVASVKNARPRTALELAQRTDRETLQKFLDPATPAFELRCHASYFRDQVDDETWTLLLIIATEAEREERGIGLEVLEARESRAATIRELGLKLQ
jgi:hypothetical protein